MSASDISAGVYTFTLASSLLGADGSKTINADIIDAAQNSSTLSTDLIFLKDTVISSISLTTTPTTPSTDTTPTWSWSATDAGSGIASFGYIYDSGTETSTTLSSYTAPSQSDGTHTFRVRAVDNAGNTSSWTTTSTIVINALPPTVGSGVTSSNVWAFGATFGWGAASDTVTAQSSLEYKLVRSFSSNINTVENAQTNGNTVMDWTANTTSYTVNNLSPSSTYYFNVIVRDSLGNMSIYTYAPVTTLVRPILLFGTSSTHDANLGGRTGADSLVQTEYTSSYSGFGYSSVKCFISVNANDELQDMPVLYSVPTTVPIYSPNGTKIANSWGELFSTGATDLLSTLYTAGVLSVNWENWWSGSNEDGSTDGQTCSEWSSATGAASVGSSGRQNITGTNNWIWNMSVAAGGRTYKILGIAY